MAKRFLAILFMILFVFSLSAVTVLAADEPSETESVAAEDNTGEIAVNTAETAEAAGESEVEADNAADEAPPTERNAMSYLIIAAVVIAIIAVIAVVVLRNKKLVERIKKFFRDYRSELKKIVWPTRPQVIQNTAVVLVAIIFIAIVVGALDLVFGLGVKALAGI